MARPDERILMNIEGYQFKKAKAKGEVFVTSPQGVNVTLDIDILKTFLASVENDPQIKEQFGL